jgi:hypothetical protein
MAGKPLGRRFFVSPYFWNDQVQVSRKPVSVLYALYLVIPVQPAQSLIYSGTPGRPQRHMEMCAPRKII